MAAGARGGLGIASWILVGGAFVMMIFVALGGVKDTTPLNKVQFLSADTSSIPGARAQSQWTYFYVCGADNKDCGDAVPAMPVGYAWVGNTKNAPSGIVGSLGKHTTARFYYYMWRVGWSFLLLGLLSAAFTILTGFLAFTKIGSGVSSLFALAAAGAQGLGAILMTVTFVKMQKDFHSASQDAKIGKYAFGFTWGAAVALFLASILYFLGCCTGRKSDHVSTRKSFFGRKASTRSRGSFIDTESQGRVVKDEEFP